MKTHIRLLTVATVTACLGLAGCRGDTSREPPVHLNPNMDFQDKYKPQASSDFFEDGRASRMPPANTLPRTIGEVGVVQNDWGDIQTMNEFREQVESDRYIKTNIAFWCGKSEGAIENCAEEKGPWVTSIPISVLKPRNGARNLEAEAFVRRGQERYNIYCTPCHGEAGYGQGKVAIRSDYAIAPPNFHAVEYGARTPGEIYHTITYGKGEMSHYRHQITDPIDRWAIVNYVRALQYSQNYEAHRVKPKKKEEPKTPVVIPEQKITNPFVLEEMKKREAQQGQPPAQDPNAQPGPSTQPTGAPSVPSEGSSGQGAPSEPQGAPSVPVQPQLAPTPNTPPAVVPSAPSPAETGGGAAPTEQGAGGGAPTTPTPAVVPATPGSATPNNPVTPVPAPTGANETK